MNILKNVVNKIAESDKKTELASEKVELALLDDLQKQSAEANEFIKRINSLKSEVKNTKKLFEQADKDYDKKIKIREKAKSAYEKAQSQANKLESDYSMARTSANSTLDDLRAYDKGLKQEQKDLNKIQSSASKITKRLSDNIGKAEQAEKNLGVKMPRLKEYRKALQDLNSALRD